MLYPRRHHAEGCRAYRQYYLTHRTPGATVATVASRHRTLAAMPDGVPLGFVAGRKGGTTCPNSRRYLLHILPNVTAPIIIIATAGLGSVILAEASLSFLGLGTPPPAPSWGGMLSGQAQQFGAQYPWLVVVPGAAITFAVLGFNLLGDALRDVWDPRLRGTQ